MSGALAPAAQRIRAADFGLTRRMRCDADGGQDGQSMEFRWLPTASTDAFKAVQALVAPMR